MSGTDMSDGMKLRERHIHQVHRNKKLKEWYDGLPTQHDVSVAVETVDFIKRVYPDLRDVLLGELIWEEIEED